MQVKIVFVISSCLGNGSTASSRLSTIVTLYPIVEENQIQIQSNQNTVHGHNRGDGEWKMSFIFFLLDLQTNIEWWHSFWTIFQKQLFLPIALHKHSLIVHLAPRF